MTGAQAALARAAEAGIHCLPIPTPFRVGPVNTYLIDDDPLTLVDTGPNSGTALDALERALAAHGRRVEQLGLIVVSHQHVDHLGLVEILARRSGAEVAALDRLAPRLERWNAGADADDAFNDHVMAEHGVPADLRAALIAGSHTVRAWGAPATVTRPLVDGAELVLRDRALRVLHRPGHSPSDTLLHDERARIALGADHLLAHISSNPLIARPLDADDDAREPPPRPHALEAYVASLRATRAMRGVDVVLTGHGAPIDDHVALIDERFRLYARRGEKILRLIAGQPLTAYEVARRMWGAVALAQAFLTLSEVLGHLDLLVADGRAAERRDGELVRYAAAG